MLRKMFFLFLIYTLPFQYILADGIIKEQTLTTSEGKTLNVKSDLGNVAISTWNKSEAYVKISGNDNAKENLTFNIEEKSGDIYIVVEKQTGVKYLKEVNLKIEVSIPSKFNSNIKTAGGDINLTEITGDIDMKTAGGNIEIKNVKGDVNLKTAGGDIKIESSAGNINAKTAGGNIDITGTEGAINAKTAGGDISVKYKGENKGINLATAGGDVYLNIPENFSAIVDLSTTSGEIKSDFSLNSDVRRYENHKMKGTIGSGGELIKCRTTGGNISLEKSK